MRHLITPALLALALAAPHTAQARPHQGPGMMGGQRPDGPPMDRGQRERMLRKMHTVFVVELGDILELDTATTIKMSEKLARHVEQRVQLQLDNFEAMEQLRRAAKGEGSVDAAATARRIAQNRIQLAQVDQAELNEVLTGLSPEKAAKAALLMTKFPKRMEHLAGKARGQGPMGPDMPPPPMGDDHDD